ncbi:DsbA family oxidoreductase [Paraburkholderia phymatum]|uniref:DSBA oxidoreductase n=1 Tax=Paraburkholderia phymatum (strain DSM 17167 / CIP 108236 / LMG 21445 / STM815) TaxID=391038 RepID=B2JV52_PARP8|nr:DsbA family oxidoreductase [Paraburkholderia phymatum]ACC74829.1 DSBA oxidoreductase [Paraburkholderia phymatum STM815]
MQAVQIAFAYDFICPWCWIGHTNLNAGMQAAAPGAPVEVRYLPFELNPSMPVQGMDRRAYRAQKFGSWARSQMLDAQATAAGVAAGLAFDYAKVARTPNTRRAHQFMQFAMLHGDRENVARVFDAIFAAYFSQGRDIGSIDTLVAIAQEQGFDASRARAWLISDEGNRALTGAQSCPQRAVINSVPTVWIDGISISGAQPPAVFAHALRAAVTQGSTA